jgi:hypothetical protein
MKMNCPPEQLTVRYLAGASVSVSVGGCGVQTDYVAGTPCADGQCTFKGWVRNTAGLRSGTPP